MTPEKALNLVQRYSSLTRGIKDAKKRIGEHMDACKGLSGTRGDVDANGCWINPPKEDRKGRDTDMHLWDWYEPETDDFGNLSWLTITEKEHGIQCPHCYAAHLAIQERKTMRKELAAVKGAITRGGTQ